MTTPAIVKRAYSAVTLFSLLNMVALLAAIAYLCAAGVVDGDKLRLVGAVLRGEDLLPAVSVEPKPEDEKPREEKPEPPEDALAESSMSLEITRREAERIKEELRQQLALAHAIMLRVETEREAYRTEREENFRQDAAVDTKRNTTGFKRQMEILKGLKPSVAAGHILAMKDPNEAARILQEMGTRSAKKIIEAIKSDEELAQIREILRLMRETGTPNSDLKGAYPE